MIHRKRTLNQFERRRGAALVEMALVVPIFFTVLLGIVEFGRAMMVGQLVTNAAREGVRMAIVDGSSNTEVTSWIDNFLQQSMGAGPGIVTTTITITPAPGNTTTGNEVSNAQPRDLITVSVAVPFNEVDYVASKYLADKNIVAQSSMRHE